MDSKPNRIALERVKSKQMSDTTSLIAVGREPKRKIFYECGVWFIIRPAHSSREFSIFAEERRASDSNISMMTFVTNHHVLV